MMRTTTLAMISFILFGAMVGCQTDRAASSAGYTTVAKDPRRDTDAARRHNARGIEHLQAGRLDAAEKELRAALEADVFFGPAHNNLGTVYYRRYEYYNAAWEFQYAAKLMAHSAEPRNNLGLVFEAVGRLDEAAAWYDKALSLAPDAVEITANLARTRIRAGQTDARTRQLLEEIVLKDTRGQYTAWAREQLVTMGATPPQPSDVVDQ